MISMIAAVSRNRVIGKDGDLPWHLPDDMKRFAELTANHPVIMGRKTFDSLPEKFKPLPNRTNIVVTRQTSEIPGVITANSKEEALEKACEADGSEEIFIIGGGQIYNLFLGSADRIYLTEVNTEIDGDTQFPVLDENQWEKTSFEEHSADEKHQFSFIFNTYDRKK